MKAGIALGMLATRACSILQPALATRIVMLWTTDEETGSETSRAVLETEARQSDAVLVLEPALPGGVLKTQRKGCGEYEVVVHGEAAHAGVDPGKGVSAIRELARQILAIETLQDLEKGISVNVASSKVAAGPMWCRQKRARSSMFARRPRRTPSGSTRHCARLTPHLKGARIEVRGGFGRPPMERTPGVVRLLAVAQAVGVELGTPVGEGATGGGSDGNFCAALGVPTLDGLGAIGDGAHALHEHVSIRVARASRHPPRWRAVSPRRVLLVRRNRTTTAPQVTAFSRLKPSAAGGPELALQLSTTTVPGARNTWKISISISQSFPTAVCG